MTDSEKETLRGLQGFIEFAIQNDKPFGWVLANLGHDVGGLLRQDPLFLPRTHGYVKYLKVDKA